MFFFFFGLIFLSEALFVFMKNTVTSYYRWLHLHTIQQLCSAHHCASFIVVHRSDSEELTTASAGHRSVHIVVPYSRQQSLTQIYPSPPTGPDASILLTAATQKTE
jgi:hypothetical protein